METRQCPNCARVTTLDECVCVKLEEMKLSAKRKQDEKTKTLSHRQEPL